MQETWEAIVAGETRGPGPSLARAGLRALTGLYALGLRANHWVYDAGLKSRTEPALPVISIGNLSLGGTGKTTATTYVARLTSKVSRPGIVLRGYRRPSELGPLLVSDGTRVVASYEEAGDEALMLARALPQCPVAVGKRREKVIETLADQTPAQLAILDDGLQYFRMKRDLEIVLLDAMADEASWRLFPAGRLREPAYQLRRAHQIWITHADLAPTGRVEQLKSLARSRNQQALIAATRHRPGALRPLVPEGQTPESLEGLSVVAVSALGNPASFEQSLEALGARVTPLRFPDHHRYTAQDWGRVMDAAASAEFVVTTEKDAIKLPDPPPNSTPVAVVGCDLEFIDEGTASEEGILVVARQAAAH